MDESRNIPRNQANSYLGIYDSATNILMGRLADITIKGFQLLSKSSFEHAKIYKFRLEIPWEISDSQWIDLQAQCIWCQGNEDGKHFTSGFQLQNITDKSLEMIEELIKSPIFKEGLMLKKDLIGPKFK